MSDNSSRAAADDKANDLTGMPRWVKVFLIVGAVVVLVVVVALLIGGGQHGPGRHLSSSPAQTTQSHPVMPPTTGR